MNNKKTRSREDITGQTFNKLTVIRKMGIVKSRTHYLCKCICGTEVNVACSKLKNGHTKSCGCLRNELDQGKGSRKPEGEASRNRVISNYKSNALSKGLEMSLSGKQMIELFSNNCHYCGISPSTLSHPNKCNGPFLYNGIDRLNNDKAYTIDNVVTCCSECNYKKSSQSYIDFVNWINKVYINLQTNKLKHIIGLNGPEFYNE